MKRILIAVAAVAMLAIPAQAVATSLMESRTLLCIDRLDLTLFRMEIWPDMEPVSLVGDDHGLHTLHFDGISWMHTVEGPDLTECIVSSDPVTRRVISRQLDK